MGPRGDLSPGGLEPSLPEMVHQLSLPRDETIQAWTQVATQYVKLGKNSSLFNSRAHTSTVFHGMEPGPPKEPALLGGLGDELSMNPVSLQSILSSTVHISLKSTQVLGHVVRTPLQSSREQATGLPTPQQGRAGVTCTSGHLLRCSDSTRASERAGLALHGPPELHTRGSSPATTGGPPEGDQHVPGWAKGSK